jgi:hydroxymethylbilane synthase
MRSSRSTAPSSPTTPGEQPGVRIATRASALARWQAERVAALLGGDAELVIVSTTGDQRADVPIHAMGGTGVFVREVQEAVLDGRADIAVHSAKDLPSERVPDLVIAAVPERADFRDALVGSTLDDLSTGASVGTGSVRRRAQLAALRPDLTFGELRGNMETRLRKAEGFDAIVVAAAALDRLGLSDRIAERLEPTVMLPQVAQGALAVECRADATDVVARMAAIDDSGVHRMIDAERAFLAELGGDCNLPCGAYAQPDGEDIELEVMLASLDGRIVIRVSDGGHEPLRLGRDLARRLLDENGGRALLEDVAPMEST